MFENLDLPVVPPGAMISGMMVEQRKIVELARAPSVEPDILLLDEITQSLSLNNRTISVRTDKKTQSNGQILVIVITHDIEEMLAISDSITVLRDGEVVGDVITSETTANKSAILWLGATSAATITVPITRRTTWTRSFSSAENVTVAGEIENISFDLHKGEILGFCGLSDSGIHSVGKVYSDYQRQRTGSSADRRSRN